jgi:hypothetical protein
MSVEQETKAKLKGEVYKEHVDACEQCSGQPFNLCDKGYELLFGDFPRRPEKEDLDIHRNCKANYRDLQAQMVSVERQLRREIDRSETCLRTISMMIEQRKQDGERIASLALNLARRMNENARLKAGICIAGWHCPECKGFVGEEKEEQKVCIHCEAAKPASFIWTELDEL